MPSEIDEELGKILTKVIIKTPYLTYDEMSCEELTKIIDFSKTLPEYEKIKQQPKEPSVVETKEQWDKHMAEWNKWKEENKLAADLDYVLRGLYSLHKTKCEIKS